MTAKKKEQEEQAAFERVFDRIRRTTLEEWLRLLEMYETEDPEAPLTEPVEVMQRRFLSSNGSVLQNGAV